MIGKRDLIKKGMVLAAGFLVMLLYAAVFLPFLPGRHAMLGHDYGLKLPQLLDGYFWFRNNGFFSVYWFSPSFCGGVPVFAHPINHYYSVIQLLTFWTGPLPAVGLSFLIFGLLGFGGSYVLMHRACDCSRPVAFLCAVIFLFNGFYWSKFLIGALDYHAFMLIPWAVFFLLTPHAGEKGKGKCLQNNLLAGLVIAYMVFSGLQTLLPAILLAVFLTSCVFGLLVPRPFLLKVFCARFFTACLGALGICASKLVAVYYFMGNFSRVYYPLPQFGHPADLLSLLVKSLWGTSEGVLNPDTMINLQFVLGRHEFEFGVGPVPFIVITGSVVLLLIRRFRQASAGLTVSPCRWPLFLMVCVMAVIPMALNLYTPWWNAFLKQVPVISSSTQCVRWFSVYIPVLVMLNGIALEKMPISKRLRHVLALAGVLGTLLFNITLDRNYYHLQQTYSGLRVQQAFRAVEQGVIDPAITDISIPVDDCGRVRVPVSRNDAFIYNHSQMLCYDSIFGYSLESLPFKTLHPGSVTSVTDGVFNIKNPACYVFPEANGCSPGDHFTVDQEQAVHAFTRYRPFPFAMPLLQKAANGVTLCCLLAFLGLLVVLGAWQVWRGFCGNGPMPDDGKTC